jgi:hypothetical protein
MADPITITINGEMREEPWTADPTATIEFIRPVFVRHADGTVIEPGSDGPVSVATDGTFTLPVMPTNDPAWDPVGWTYQVVIFDGERRYKYNAAVPYDAPGGVMPLPIPALTASQGASYAPINHTHPAGDHTHEIPDVDDLQAELSLKLEADDIAHLASDESVEERLAGKSDTSHVHLPLQLLLTPRPGTTWYSTDSPFDSALTSILDTGDRFTYPLGHAQERETYEWNGSSWVGPVSTLEDIPASVDAMIVHPRAFGGYLDISTAPTTGTWAVGDIVETRVGRFRCTVAGSPGTWIWLQASEAMDSGFAGWMGPPRDIQGSLIMTAGIPYVFRFRADAPTISAMNLHLVTPGSALTNAFWTLHNDDGSIVSATAKSADQSTNLQTGGERTMTIPTQNVTPGAFYRGRVWTTGTTQPTLSRRCSSSNAAINAGNQLWYSSAAGGLTNLASAPDNIGALSTTVPTVAWWAAWKP